MIYGHLASDGLVPPPGVPLVAWIGVSLMALGVLAFGALLSWVFSEWLPDRLYDRRQCRLDASASTSV